MRKIVLGIIAGSILTGIAWGVVNKFDVIDLTTGLRIGGAATSGQYLRGDGTNFVSSTIATGDLPSGMVDATTDLAGALCGTNQILEDQGASWACINTPAAGASDAIEIEQGDNTGTFDAIDTTARFDDSGDVGFAFSDGGAGGPDIVTATIRADKITEAMLKAVDAAVDEECLTYETTTGDFEWQSCGTGAPGGVSTNVQFNEGGAFGGDAEFTWNTTNKRLDLTSLTTASDNADNMIDISGTMPTTPSAAVAGLDVAIAGAGSAAQVNRALFLDYTAGYTGGSRSATLEFRQRNAGTGNTLSLNSATTPAMNVGITGDAEGATAGLNVGAFFEAFNSTSTNIGLYGRAADNEAGTNIGILGNAANSTEGTDLKNVGVLATLGSSLPTANVSTALLADNGSGTDDIARFYDNGTVAARIADAGLIVPPSFTVAGLPSCVSGLTGARATVTDANAACTFAAAPTGGGSTVCPVYCDGSAWLQG